MQWRRERREQRPGDGKGVGMPGGREGRSRWELGTREAKDYEPNIDVRTVSEGTCSDVIEQGRERTQEAQVARKIDRRDSKKSKALLEFCKLVLAFSELCWSLRGLFEQSRQKSERTGAREAS